MIRTDMISTVGRAYLTSNIENDEYSYPKACDDTQITAKVPSQELSDAMVKALKSKIKG